MAADIETLIRQALARQNGFDPMVRAKIYQSSRNALAKMIANSGAIPLDVINARNKALEDTIAKIEQEFTAELSNNPPSEVPPPPMPPIEATSQVSVPPSFDPAPPPVPPVNQQYDPQPTVHSPPQSVEPNIPPAAPQFESPVMPNPEVPNVDIASPEIPIPRHQTQQAAGQVHAQEPQIPPNLSHDNVIPPQPGQYQQAEYSRPSRKPFRYLVWLIAIIILALAGWIAYSITASILQENGNNQSQNPSTRSLAENNDQTFVTILQPEEPGALITGGNGTAKILDDASQPAIRVQSVRKPDTPDTPAEPLLLELAPGILNEIAGKRTTVEILAKSGDNRPATFTISCQFGSLGECGRKRFRIGLQPEAVVFSIQLSENASSGERAFLAINTDVTSAAAHSGRGANIDIIYARLKAGG